MTEYQANGAEGIAKIVRAIAQLMNAGNTENLPTFKIDILDRNLECVHTFSIGVVLEPVNVLDVMANWRVNFDQDGPDGLHSQTIFKSGFEFAPGMDLYSEEVEAASQITYTFAGYAKEFGGTFHLQA